MHLGAELANEVFPKKNAGARLPAAAKKGRVTVFDGISRLHRHKKTYLFPG